MPKVQYRSNCKPSTFAYPPALEVPKEKEKEKVSARGSRASRGLSRVPDYTGLFVIFTCVRADMLHFVVTVE